eukprot:198238_1
MSRKYVPPHKRRSSANKPPPASTNASFRENKKKYNQYKKLHSNRITLKETETYEMSDQIETVDLDQLLIEKQESRQISIQILSKHTHEEIAKLIFEFCNNLLILIPNTFDRNELLKHWFVIGKGPLINEYREFQRVDLYPNYVKFTRRGGIASIKGYKPSKTAKLRLICKFIYRHPKEGLRFVFRSNGCRDLTLKGKGQHGNVYTEGTMVILNGSLGQFGNNRYAHQVCVIQNDGDFTIEKRMKTSVQPMNKQLEMIIIDDGQKMKITYVDHEKNIYSMECDSTCISNPKGLHRIALYNRRDHGRISDITYLQLSIVTTQ